MTKKTKLHRWLEGKVLQLGAAWDAHQPDTRSTARPAVSARNRRSCDEGDIIRKDVVSPDAGDYASEKDLHAAWMRKEAHVDIGTARGAVPTAEDLVKHLPDPNAVHGPRTDDPTIDWDFEEEFEKRVRAQESDT